MKYYILLIAVLIGFSSCEETENTATPSQVTYLPYFEILGDQSVELACDATDYTDAGANATEGGTAIDMTTTITGRYFGSSTVDGPDFYDINYSAENVDGIPGVATRNVYWPECQSDLVSGIEGMYTAAVFRTQPSSGNTVDYSDEEFGPYFIKDLGDGQYGFTCVIGQFYEQGYGYGPAYSGTGFVVTANNIATNDFTVDATEGVGAFGGDIEVTDIVVDSGAGTVSFTSTWSFGYVFEVVLTQAD